MNAPTDPGVDGTVDQSGVPVITLTYEPGQLLESESGERMGTAMRNKFRALCTEHTVKQPASCVVVINARVAGSPTVKGLYELFREVHAGGGAVRCVGYPKEYLWSITSLGLPKLEGFKLVSTLEQAIRELKPKA